MTKTRLIAWAAAALFLSACSKQEPAAPAPADTAPPAATVPAEPAPAASPAADAAPAGASAAAAAGGTDTAAVGKSVFGKACSLCHAAGVAGAPKPGDKADWGPRIAQGKETLYKHAIEGFTGSKGVMPPKGGSSALSDDDVKAAVDYMVGQSS